MGCLSENMLLCPCAFANIKIIVEGLFFQSISLKNLRVIIAVGICFCSMIEFISRSMSDYVTFCVFCRIKYHYNDLTVGHLAWTLKLTYHNVAAWKVKKYLVLRWVRGR